MVEEGDETHSFKENRTDIYFQAFTIYNANLKEEIKFLEFSKTAYYFGDGIGQILNEPNNSKTDLSSFLVQNWNLLSYMLIGYLLLFFFSYIFLKKLFPFLSPLKKSKLISSKFFYDDYTQLRAFSSKIALIFLFFNFFLFILINLLTNFIQTEAVIVNTDQLIDSNEKLLSTPKILYATIFKFYYFSNSPKNSLLFKFFTRKKENNQCLTESNSTKILEIIKKGESSSLFFYKPRPFLLATLGFVAEYTKNPIIFVKPTSYHEIIWVYYMRKNLEKNKKKFINQW